MRNSDGSASYLTTQPRPLSPQQRRNLSIFQPILGHSSVFSVELHPPPIPFHWVASFRQPPTQYLSPGWEFLSIFQSSPTQSLDHDWVCPGYFTPHPWHLSGWEGAGKLHHCHIKLRITINLEIFEPGETYPNSSALPEEEAGCKGPLLVPKLRVLVDFRRRMGVHSGLLRRLPSLWSEIDTQLERGELGFIWGKMRSAAWEAAPQRALGDCSKDGVGKVNI